jgi:hypothetical protein
MQKLVLPPPCDCDNDQVAVVVNASNEARARCLDCGEEGVPTVIDGPADTLR